MVHDTDIVELELKSKKFSISLRKKEALATPEPIYQMVGFSTFVQSFSIRSRQHRLLPQVVLYHFLVTVSDYSRI